MKTYTIEVTVPNAGGSVRFDARRTLRVRGASEPQAIMGAYDFLARQYDGAGEVHESTLVEVA